MRTSTFGILLIAGIWTSAAAAAEGATVTLCMRSSETSQWLMAGGKDTASRILAQAGVKLVWLASERPCSKLPGGIVIKLSIATPPSLHPDAFAYALPYKGDEIVVFYDRIRRASTSEMFQRQMIGHVLAHEITHVLEGVARHSDSGLMKPRWSDSDRLTMRHHPLLLSKEDLVLIEIGLLARTRIQPLPDTLAALQSASR